MYVLWACTFRRNFISELFLRFLKSQLFFHVLDLRNLQEKVKKAFCLKNCTDLSRFKLMATVISKVLQILSLQPEFQKLFSITRTILETNTVSNFSCIFSSLNSNCIRLLPKKTCWVAQNELCICDGNIP
jgi:hypothetical protein